MVTACGNYTLSALKQCDVLAKPICRVPQPLSLLFMKPSSIVYNDLRGV